jgi:hypothetical protein
VAYKALKEVGVVFVFSPRSSASPGVVLKGIVVAIANLPQEEYEAFSRSLTTIRLSLLRFVPDEFDKVAETSAKAFHGRVRAKKNPRGGPMVGIIIKGPQRGSNFLGDFLEQADGTRLHRLCFAQALVNGVVVHSELKDGTLKV